MEYTDYLQGDTMSIPPKGHWNVQYAGINRFEIIESDGEGLGKTVWRILRIPGPYCLVRFFLRQICRWHNKQLLAIIIHDSGGLFW